MLLGRLLRGIGEYRLFSIDPHTDITEPFSDSREAVRGGVFICIKGGSTDGHDYIEEAFKKGAAVAVTEGAVEGYPCVAVGDTRFAAAVIWNNFFERPGNGLRIFGVTGTNGKTSVAEFLSSCLSAEGRRVGTIGTLGTFAMGAPLESGGSEKSDAIAKMTTPDPRFLYGTLREFVKAGVEDVVMEVSSHSIFQKKVDAICFHAGIFTNLSRDHLDLHKSMEEYYRVKASFVARCENRIVNGDDADCRRFASAVPSVAVGYKDIDKVRVSNGSVSYEASLFGKRLFIESSVGGEFTVYNTLLSATAALNSGVGPKSVEEGIRRKKAIKGRMERVAKKEDWGFDVFCDYAHTPDALERVLSHLRKNTKGKLICVFGCGGDRDRTKRPLMGRVAECLADGVVVTSDNPRTEDPLSVIRDIIRGMSGDNSVVIPSREEAVFFAVAAAKKGDTVLLAGKGHETYEIGREGLSPFDEREVVKKALKLKYGK